MARARRAKALRYNEIVPTDQKLASKESDWEAMALAASLKEMSEEEQIDLLSRLDVDSFRNLLKYYRPNDRIVERISARRKRRK